jgi:hypothetical protein
MRSWSVEDKTWTVHLRCWERVEALLHAYFDHVEVARERAGYSDAHSTNSHPPREPYCTLHLLESAPDGVCKAAYRAMAQLTHPDHGGTTEAMRQVNLAFEQIAKERQW